jgi:hypothetical protein
MIWLGRAKAKVATLPMVKFRAQGSPYLLFLGPALRMAASGCMADPARKNGAAADSTAQSNG